MRGLKKGLFLVMLCIPLLLSRGITVYAAPDSIENDVDEGNNARFSTTSPWLKGTTDESIYGNPIDAGEEEQDISVGKPGRVEKYIAELLRNIGSSIISLLQDNIGASLDSIVYGRVGSGQPNKVNIYAFELRKGNPYGVTASVCYALLRGMMFIFLGITFVFQLAKSAWTGQTAKSRDEIKSMLPTMVLKFAALILMPYLLDVALYVRDVLLYGIKEVTSQMITGGATLSLSKAFLINAERSGTFVDAVMYLGTVVLTVYFVFLYVAVAIDMLVCFVSFPFLCVLQSRKRDLLNGWVMTVFSNLMTPVIDAVLLLIPLLTSLMLSDTIKGVAVIQLVMCMLLIPARTRFKALLGIQSNERNGFLGAMAMMTLARAVASRIRQGAGKLADAFSDARKSRMYGEMADVDREEEESYLSAAEGKGNAGSRLSEAENGVFGAEKGQETENGIPSAGTENKMPGEREAMPGPDKESNDFTGTELARYAVPEPSYSGAMPDAEDAGTGATPQSRNDLLRSVDGAMNQSQDNMDKLKIDRAELMQQDKELRRQMLNHRRGSEEYRKLEMERADIESQTALLDKRIAMENGRLNQLRQQSRQLHSAMGIHGTPTTFDDRKAEILQKRANISNFEQPEFKGILSNAQMRDLYRKRAVANAVKVATGTGGAVAVGAVAGGSAVFLGASAVALSSAGGIQAGGGTGELAVDASIEAGRIAGSAVRNGGKRIYQAADMAASAYLMNKIRPAAMQVSIQTEIIPDTGSTIGTAEIPILNKEEKETVNGMAFRSGNQIQADAAYAVQEILSVEGTMRNSTALRAMQQANLQAEKEIAVMREENKVVLTEELIRTKRIEAQTVALSEAILLQLEKKAGYERGSEDYENAANMIQERVKQILEDKNRPLV
ncbi:MAG: hypothetical protein J1E98_08655 [Lachnospiraceae bacterium]|nr:hypothetical protein [Lachnospiraceae bacterium]